MIGGEAVGVVAEHVPRELVEQDHGGERLLGGAEEGLDRALPLLFPKLAEALGDLCIELRVSLPPLLWREAEPEVDDLLRPAHQAAVPPTVRPSISKVGWPTPAGTD